MFVTSVHSQSLSTHTHSHTHSITLTRTHTLSLTHTHTHTKTLSLTHTAAVVGFAQETYTTVEGVEDRQGLTVVVSEGTLGFDLFLNVRPVSGGTATGA